jgi:hypothetical protein
MRTLGRLECAAVLAAPGWAAAQAPSPDPWAPVRFLVGAWEGEAGGKAGDGTVERRYEFTLGQRYLHERNTSTYPPQERNKKGEVHEHWSFISYDRARKMLVLRQFHIESFVIQYAMNAEKSTPTRLVFESEWFENFDNRWRARETYEIASADEFTETFELAGPDKPFEVYSKNHFKRRQSP